MNITTDRIEKQLVIRAPRDRVWRAISTPEQFGAWFKVDLAGQEFHEGRWTKGRMTYPGFEGEPFEVLVERVEPQRLFAFRWHPYGVEANEGTPTTLIEFALEEASDGTRLTVTESGFDALPLSVRAESLRRNTEGWEIQLQNIDAYVTSPA